MSHGACGERSKGGSDTRRAGGWEVRCRLWAPVMAWGGVGRGWSGWAGGRKGEAEASAQGPEAPACRANSATGSGANVERGGGGGGSGAGGGRRWAWVGGGWAGRAVRSWALGVGGVWWWWVRPATCVLLRGSDEGEDCMGTEAGEPGAGEWGAGGGLSPAGMAGVPWGPVGAEAPHVGWVRNLGLFFRPRRS